MTTTVRARTARKPHHCEGCGLPTDPNGQPTIAPGHRYLLHTAFPDGYEIIGDRPWTVRQCIACAEDRDEVHLSRGLALACITFCCADVPCALPHRHDGDHSCRRCAFYRIDMAASA